MGETMTITKTCLTVSVLIMLTAGMVSADQNDSRLDELFRIIQQTDNPELAYGVEDKIWEIWFQHDDQRTQERLAEGTAAMETNPGKALLIFNELVEEVPDFAEGWNRRATLLYLLREYAASARDIEKTLELEPRHFGALSGLGLVYLAQQQYVEAKSAFEAVLLIYPHNRNVQKNIELINDYLRRNTIITRLFPPSYRAKGQTRTDQEFLAPRREICAIDLHHNTPGFQAPRLHVRCNKKYNPAGGACLCPQVGSVPHIRLPVLS